MTYTIHPIANGEYKWGVFENDTLMKEHLYKTEAEAKAAADKLNERKK